MHGNEVLFIICLVLVVPLGILTALTAWHERKKPMATYIKPQGVNKRK